MLKIVAFLVLALLQSCGGGGGSSDGNQTFTPSLDLGTTHPWLIGEWTGTSTSDQGGPRDLVSLWISYPPITSTASYLNCGMTFTFAGSGTLQASGSQFRVDSPSRYGRVELTGTLGDNHRSLAGTYRRWFYQFSETEPIDSGTFSMEKAQASTLEVYQSPGWLIVVKEAR